MADRDPLNIAGQTILEKYRIDKLVGEGGFAVVYRAEHTIWKKPVAIKFFNGLSTAPVDQREELQEAFITEGALLTELSSQTANIVQARDVGSFTTADGQWMPYMVLEWLDGLPLDELLEREGNRGHTHWSLSEAYRLLSPAAQALEVAHRKGITHRDIKPPNLFVLGDPASGDTTVKVLDFGVAKMVTDNTHLKAALAKTGTNITSFTPQYGAPEQFSRSYGATGPWTDVYALALVVVELLIGRPALDGEDLVQLAFASGNPQQRPTPRTYGVNVPDGVEAVFQKALSTQPTARYSSAGEFWAALGAVVGTGEVVATSDTLMVPSNVMAALTTNPHMATAAPVSTITGVGSLATTQTPPAKGSKLGLVAVAGVLLLAVVAGAAVLVTRGGKETPAASAATSAATPPSASASAIAPAGCPDNTVQIPAGQFFMGSDSADANENEKPSHNVKLESFCMDLHEVTAAEYKACSSVGKCRRAPTEVDWPNIKESQRKLYSTLCTAHDPAKSDHPINCIDWGMARDFCGAAEKRLPSEAEWEYATRGPDGRVYPWGDEAPTANHLNACGTECVKWAKEHGEELSALYDADDGYPTTAPVGKFPPGSSRFGPQDVVGNVWEWVADWEGPYASEMQANPSGPASGERRVIRGGAFNGSDKNWLRPSFRFAFDPKARSHGIGFRCAKSLPK